MAPHTRLTDEQKAEVVRRYELGEGSVTLGREYDVHASTILKYIKAAGAQKLVLDEDIEQFTKRAKQVLWQQDHGREKKTFYRWKQRYDVFKRSVGRNNAAIEASKEFPCLTRLLHDYGFAIGDPPEESSGDTLIDGIENEGREQSHRENLSWAIDTAGKYLRTQERPTSCPNDAAFYLYRQAIEEPKDFLGKFTQIEAKGSDELEEQRRARKSGRRSIEEINEMLATLTQEN